jgi:phosphatidylserine/phosphatidylglycerophosphate/cardiolipin synthase-like enzyme
VAIEATTLTDGGQSAVAVAAEIAGFLAEAERTLDLALYDVRFETEAGAKVLDALTEAHGRGVRVRILYNVDHPGPIPVPPPPEMSPDAVESLPVETRGVAGEPDLMHHKFVVRDATDVWMGSTNWTDDSWTRQENVILRVFGSEPLGTAFAITFEQLWTSGTVEGTGAQPRPVDLGDILVRPWFCPAYGDALAHRIAKYLGRARTRIRIASPVLTSGPILATLVEIAAERRCSVQGVVDDTQVDEVFQQWATNGVSAWKIPLLHRVIEGGTWSGKRSTPWSRESLHDFMHAKLVVADDVVFVGSYNLSRSGERNAEAVLEVHDPSLASRMAAFVEEAVARYPTATPPDQPGRARPSAG